LPGERTFSAGRVAVDSNRDSGCTHGANVRNDSKKKSALPDALSKLIEIFRFLEVESNFQTTCRSEY
jgi:hypothetical protein